MPDLMSWPTFVLVLVIYGFAPGAVLRLICLAFHRDDPRRHELRAELYAVPRVLRPLWVAEQLEVALFDGLGERLRWAATGRVIHRWHLASGVEHHRLYPDSFWIPDETEKDLITPGAKVKLMFHMNAGWGERMWVNVDDVKSEGRLVGTLLNRPAGIPRLRPGDTIHRDDIIDVVIDASPPPGGHLPMAESRITMYCKCSSDQHNERGEEHVAESWDNH
jgi:hypothetical protein